MGTDGKGCYGLTAFDFYGYIAIKQITGIRPIININIIHVNIISTTTPIECSIFYKKPFRIFTASNNCIPPKPTILIINDIEKC